MEETDVSGSDTGEDEEKEQVVHKGMENKVRLFLFSSRTITNTE